MSIDLSQFYQVFFEESLEGLDNMEAALMALDPQQVDSETINTIFRAAHSIKGGSATFGFAVVAEFTHVLETLLDLVRDGKRGIDQQDIDLLLQSVDCLRGLIHALQTGEDPDTELTEGLKSAFEQRLSGSGAEAATVAVASNEPLGAGSTGWRIRFKPGLDVLRTGNEPLRMFRELAELGDLATVAITDYLPGFGQLNPEDCWMAWDIELRGENISEAAVREVFEWVVDESDITIQVLSAREAASSESPNPEGAGADDSQRSSTEERGTAPQSAVREGGAGAGNVSAKQVAPADSSIRVSIEKIDQLINMVGELVITQSMLGQIGRNFSLDRLAALQEGLSQLEQNTRELQESVMQIRMLPISFSFSRFPRMVRDLSKKLGKKIDLVLKGEQTELDKTVMEKIGDPLVHLVRNSLDHGIESPEARVASGKPETGKITLNAYHQGGNVVIEIMDDGKGLDKARIAEKAIASGLISASETYTDDQIHELIFHPGFSTASVVSDVSGRGVGMDVVRRNILELNGTIEVRSVPGKGTTFVIRLPLTLAILDGQLVRVGKETYIFPLVSIVESLQADPRYINKVAGGCDVFRLRDEYVPIIKLYETFEVVPEFSDLKDALLVVVEHDGGKVGIVVDELMAQQQVVIKSLEQNYHRVEGVSGATILGDGRVALILDVGGIVKMAGVVQSRNNVGFSLRYLHDQQVA